MKSFNEFLTEAYKIPVFTPEDMHKVSQIKDAKHMIGMLHDEWKTLNGPHGQNAWLTWVDSVLNSIPFHHERNTELKYQMTASWSLK